MNLKLLIFAVLTTTSFFSVSASAESLKCSETHSFRQADMFINRDGSIGFSGTYITIDASWFFHSGFKTLDQITGRSVDKNLKPAAITLYLSPKGACTNNNNSLSEDFSCSVKQGQVDITGKEFKEIADSSIVSIEDVSKRLRLTVNVDVDAKIKIIDANTRSIYLSGLIENAITGQKIKLSESMECAVE